jgi:hypothetical protein
MSLRSSGLRAHVRFTAKAAELLRRCEMTRCTTSGLMHRNKPRSNDVVVYSITSSVRASKREL